MTTRSSLVLAFLALSTPASCQFFNLLSSALGSGITKNVLSSLPLSIVNPLGGGPIFARNGAGVSYIGRDGIYAKNPITGSTSIIGQPFSGNAAGPFGSGGFYNPQTGEAGSFNDLGGIFQGSQPPTTRRPPGTSNVLQSGCGASKYRSQLIIGGEASQAGEWPWFGSLFVDESGRRLKLLCGVSLVTQKHVLTAAHCIESPREPYRYSVMLGRHNIADQRERNFQQRAVSRLELHADYGRGGGGQTADADIAVLKLKSAVTFTDFVQPVCLPKAPVSLTGVQGTVVGYGKSEAAAQFTNTPRKVAARGVSLVSCYQSDAAFTRIASERNFCAGGVGRAAKAPCKGDSGGGFYVKDSSGRWIVYGLVSEGLIVSGSCDASKYVVYVDVAKFLRWIIETLQRLQTDACDPSPCGANAECFVFADGHFCECSEGYRGDPDKGCVRR